MIKCLEYLPCDERLKELGLFTKQNGRFGETLPQHS